MELRPSDIRYSQDSINNWFRGSRGMLGSTLDDICEGRITVDDVPRIEVMKSDDHWVTSDNRRLWVFRHLERLGKCQKVPVCETQYIPANKMTSKNGGASVKVRGLPGGVWHQKFPNGKDGYSEKEENIESCGVDITEKDAETINYTMKSTTDLDAMFQGLIIQ